MSVQKIFLHILLVFSCVEMNAENHTNDFKMNFDHFVNYDDAAREKYPKSRIELHLHLEGAVRIATISDLAISKGINITSTNSPQSIKELVSVTEPVDLANFLKTFDVYMPLLVGDAKAIERIAYELCEEQAAQRVIYFEVRFSPHLLSNTVRTPYTLNPVPVGAAEALTPEAVVRLVARGLWRGLRDFHVRSRIILSTIKGQIGWSNDVLRLATELASIGVVGIDIAGNESTYSPEETNAFERAHQIGIHRTVHAGEAGPASNVRYAIEKLYAERIGHGYHVMEDQDIYRLARVAAVHFETCPRSSYLTGSVPASTVPHPIVVMAQDGVNFSINRDDPTQTQTKLNDEYAILRRMGLFELHLTRANLNAARSCFLPCNEKKALLSYLYKLYGFPNL